ncbi:right-handed parallel beta-helix repeat-containing protein [bacterium]|nr:right-handed parallel beta-helix repeat-containing protein [bacterium]
MKNIRFPFTTRTGIIIAVMVFTLIAGGCFGAMFRSRAAKLPTDGFEGNPDNCTKCHLLWAHRFDYYRGWDRYGYIFEGTGLVKGFYDPWSSPSVDNMFEAYYATGWWNTPEINAWPADISGKVESLSILSWGRDRLRISTRLADIKGTVITVAQDGGDFKSIQQAIDAAQPGATVFVRPGVYNETLVLRDGVNLIGEDPYTTIINPQNRGHALVAANHALIAGFTFTGTGIDYETKKFNAAIYAAGTDSTCIIARNIFRENGLFGVWIDGTADVKGNARFDSEHGPRGAELHDRPYTDYPNPVITGNTFYRIGQRGVFCLHARGEIFNNIFLGNVKAAGLERHSRPIIHHNVFYFNNVPMAVNRSEPVIFGNIMYSNQWGQRMLRGANPVMFGNCTWESPHFRDFDEAGRPYYYTPHPGTGEITADPGFINPLGGDFRFGASSPFRDKTTGFSARGIMRDADLPQPLPVECKNSYGREVLAMTGDIVDLIEKVDIENAKINSLSASYKILYEGYLDMKADRYGDPAGAVLAPSGKPAVMIEYDVSEWVMENSKRLKKYSERTTVGGKTTEDSGVIRYNGSYLEAESGRFAKLYHGAPDTLFVGERPFREAPGGFYRDYDQYVMGAMGSTGTFYQGFLRIMGGKIMDAKAVVDGHECIVVRYPHIGKDQYYMFYLDPEIGFRPRKMEQYYNETLCRVMDSYRYTALPNGINVPVAVNVTDYGVSGSVKGEIVDTWKLLVDEKSIMINADSR